MSSILTVTLNDPDNLTDQQIAEFFAEVALRVQITEDGRSSGPLDAATYGADGIFTYTSPDVGWS